MNPTNDYTYTSCEGRRATDAEEAELWGQLSCVTVPRQCPTCSSEMLPEDTLAAARIRELEHQIRVQTRTIEVLLSGVVGPAETAAGGGSDV